MLKLTALIKVVFKRFVRNFLENRIFSQVLVCYYYKVFFEEGVCMLVQFSVHNYSSFMSGWSLSLKAGSITEHEETHVYSNEDMRLLKSAVIYGANASGKSNFLNAIETMKTLVLHCSKESNATEEIDVTPFLLSTQ